MNERKKERSLVLIKPDGVQRALVGEIIKRYERSGLKLVAVKFLVPTEEMAERHYLIDDGWLEAVGSKTKASYEKKGEKYLFDDVVEGGKWVLGKLKKFLSSGPVVAMVWQGNEAVGIIRKITGGTEPLSSDVGTIRGDFTVDSYPLADSDSRAVRNLVHASGSPEEAEKEIKIWFDESEIIKYRLVQEQILYDVNLDGILE
ncbi:nucleoside-diphosphate kinase [Patescibacteria group bacterium]|nr:nucleoside-diphosphate kinase [Patescibacteria group bacterium]MBU2633548.1 nucleoside-diphosphate kinase [Patescibacteria group bacterium]